MNSGFQTPNRGLLLLNPASPDNDTSEDGPGYQGVQNADNLDSFFGAVSLPAAGAIAQVEGKVFLSATTAAAYTLAAPIAGLPGAVAGGMDGKTLKIIATGAHAYTVTTPLLGINGANHVATFAGAVGDQIELTAFGGVWYANGSSGVAIS